MWELAGRELRIRFGFDGRPHRTFAAFDQGVAAEGMDLIAFQFGVFLGCRQADGAARVIDLGGDLHPALQRVTEQLPHHTDHVIVGMIVVIPQDHVEARLAFRFGRLLLWFLHGSCRWRRRVVGRRLRLH